MTDRGRITAGINCPNGMPRRTIANTTHSQLDAWPSSDRIGGTVSRTANKAISPAAVAIRIRSGVALPAALNVGEF
jgi:hypothetical protein